MGHLLPTVILLIISTNLLEASQSFPLKENTLIVELDYTKGKTSETVRIECNTNGYTNAAIDSSKIEWSRNGHKGKILTVDIKGRPDAKNYTCELKTIGILDYTHVVLHEVDLPFYSGILNKKDPIHCMMKNYSGHFTCLWNGSQYHPNAEFFFEAFSNNNKLHCESVEKHITEGNAIPSYTVNCRDNQTCHYSEDPSIFVELHVISRNRYEKHKKSFTLRNIIKPDPPQDLCMSKKNNQLSVQWKYPKTWCNAHLFYELIFNVKVERNSPNKEEYYVNVDKSHLSLDYDDVTEFCVQARDMYHVNSYWSDWSCFNKEKNVKKHKQDKKKKKGKKKKNAT